MTGDRERYLEEQIDKLRDKLAAKAERVKWFEDAGEAAMTTRFFQVEAERDRLQELLRELRKVVHSSYAQKIDAALGGEGKDDNASF